MKTKPAKLHIKSPAGLTTLMLAARTLVVLHINMTGLFESKLFSRQSIRATSVEWRLKYITRLSNKLSPFLFGYPQGFEKSYSATQIKKQKNKSAKTLTNYIISLIPSRIVPVKPDSSRLSPITFPLSAFDAGRNLMNRAISLIRKNKG